MVRIRECFWNFLLRQNPVRVLIFIFLGVLILRLPTLFVEYYDIDLLTSFISAKSALAGLPFQENKGKLYHFFLESVFRISGNRPEAFHLFGILVICLTSFIIYHMGKKIHSDRAGILSALLYGFLVSSFNRQFMAINGEIIYNLFFIASFYFFFLVTQEKKFRYAILLLVSLILASQVKFQGIWAFLVLLSFFLFIYPIYAMNLNKRKFYYKILFLFILIFIIFLILDGLFFQLILTEKIRSGLKGHLLYATVRGFTWFFPIKLIHRLGMMAVYHSMLWIPAMVALFRFFKSPQKEFSRTYLVSILLFLCTTIFITGDRLYFHYFVQIYPILSLLAAPIILEWAQKAVFRKIFFYAFWVPIFFVLIWNTKDAMIVRLNPDYFYKEGKILYYFRLIVLGQDNDYLLPHPVYQKALSYLEKNAHPENTVFVWPVGAEVTYFSGLTPATQSFWHEYGAIQLIEGPDQLNTQKKILFQKQFIQWIQDVNPDFFVDVSRSPVVYFSKYGGLSDLFPMVEKFLQTHFILTGNFDGIKVWKKNS